MPNGHLGPSEARPSHFQFFNSSALHRLALRYSLARINLQLLLFQGFICARPVITYELLLLFHDELILFRNRF